jgi:hypothetical protein
MVGRFENSLSPLAGRGKDDGASMHAWSERNEDAKDTLATRAVYTRVRSETPVSRVAGASTAAAVAFALG